MTLDEELSAELSLYIASKAKAERIAGHVDRAKAWSLLHERLCPAVRFVGYRICPKCGGKFSAEGACYDCGYDVS